MIALGWAALAEAATVKLCLEINTDYVDAAPSAGTMYDDYLNDNGTARPVRGVKWKVRDTDSNTTVTAFAADSGADAGCASFTVGLDHYTISTVSAAVVGSNNTIVVTDTIGGDVYEHVWYTNALGASFAPTITKTQNGGREWGILTAAAWAVYHRDGGVANETWRLVNDSPNQAFFLDCDGDGDSSWSPDCGGPDTGDLVYSHVGSDTRALIAHELGHMLLMKLAMHGANNNDSVDTEACHNVAGETGHTYQTKEYAGEGWWEGFASAYAAIAFNDLGGGDCYVHYYKRQDWDTSGDDDPSTGSLYQPVNCDGRPDILPGGGSTDATTPVDSCIGAYDYLGDSNDNCGCGTQSLANRVAEYDVVRFVWRATASGDFTFADVAAVLAQAIANDWIGNSDTDANGAGTAPDFPSDGVPAAAIDLLGATDGALYWDYAADNGVDR